MARVWSSGAKIGAFSHNTRAVVYDGTDKFYYSITSCLQIASVFFFTEQRAFQPYAISLGQSFRVGYFAIEPTK